MAILNLNYAFCFLSINNEIDELKIRLHNPTNSSNEVFRTQIYDFVIGLERKFLKMRLVRWISDERQFGRMGLDKATQC